MSYKTIVVGTDGSPTATVAVEVAQKLAKRLRGRLVLVGALDAYGIARQPLQTALYEAAEAARAKKVDATAELIEGTPGESILAAALAHDADLIVVGNRGMGQATRFRLGSVPDWVAHDAPCDLLIVDTTGRAGPREPAPPYTRILAGTDGSGTATEAVRKANTLAHEVPSDVLIVKTVDRSVDDLLAGHGGLVSVDGRQLAVYRDDDGATYELSPRCTHMGCTVDWNDAARTWDCPCHGSRFAADGSVVHGPAAEPLERVGGTGPPREGETAPEPAPAEAVSATPRPAEKQRFVIVG